MSGEVLGFFRKMPRFCREVRLLASEVRHLETQVTYLACLNRCFLMKKSVFSSLYQIIVLSLQIESEYKVMSDIGMLLR